jgi:hypothetical protein
MYCDTHDAADQVNFRSIRELWRAATTELGEGFLAMIAQAADVRIPCRLKRASDWEFVRESTSILAETESFS